MSKEMNNIHYKNIKYDLLCGLFLSLIIVIFYSLIPALIFMLGVVISLINFRLNEYFTEKWLLNNGPLLALVSIIRIAIVVAIVIPFVKNIPFVVAYLAGFITHYAVLICCTLTTKGSA